MDSYKSTLVKWGSNRLLVYDPTPYHAGYLYTTRLPNKQEYSTPIHRIHDEQVTKSCILWSGVLERSFGVEYWSGVKFWRGKSSLLAICSLNRVFYGVESWRGVWL